MDPKQLFIDERLLGVCSYCGGIPESRDHVPSRVLLDKPYPENLPVVESCIKCNSGFSKDEEYLACFVECVKEGGTTLDTISRPSIRKTLKSKPLLKQRIENSKRLDAQENIIWEPELDRIRKVILKLAQGHMTYELGVQHLDSPSIINIVPLHVMTNEAACDFLSSSDHADYLCPEIGSRAFIGLFKDIPSGYGRWYQVQDGLYKYMVGQSSGDWVRLIISDYLACSVLWD